MDSRIMLLIKIFDKEEYADAFLNNGEIFCQTLESFKKIEDAGVRGDTYEAVSSWYQPDQVSLIISYKDDAGVEHKIPLMPSDLAGPIITQLNKYNHLNLYCMYAVIIPEFNESYTTEEEKLLVSEKINSMLAERTTLDDEVLSLGKYAVIIHSVNDFIEKVESAAKERNYQCRHKPITYFDSDSFNGSVNELEAVFRKRHCYKYQSEYRFAFATQELVGPKTIHIGPIGGIAIKVPTESIKSKLRLKVKI
ncbi:hypothetical protein M2366_001384 [Aeromonas sp. BIGb0405]|uniref:hypothetical protein n=1 Tax=Aeromonas sp. BIGb0405 TaxID=2940592 RepID=UPI002168A9C8|nr:hypothetical protein [Aeromonas sp. BIGb0405]MCS3455317.1 hypothetical protein [Aeromonas sp. BIGb0405]